MMFAKRDLSAEVETVRERHAPSALVFDCDVDFETLPPEALDDLAMVTTDIDPIDHPDEWVPDATPEILRRYAGGEFVVGMPGNGSVVRTRQTTPPVCLVKARVRGSPEAFVEFLVAEALVEVGLEVPEQFLGFFEEAYPDLVRAIPLGPTSTYQIATALYEAWIGLRTREVFAEWEDDLPGLAAAWLDAGSRLEPRLDDLSREVATGETGFADATEYACSAIKHTVEVPSPFGALDTQAYREYGPEYAIEWAETTFETLVEE